MNLEEQRARLVAQTHRLIRLRLTGWVLIGVWQALSLVVEFFPFFDIESRPVRIVSKVSGLVGLLIVAYGFERFAEVSHRLARLHD